MTIYQPYGRAAFGYYVTGNGTVTPGNNTKGAWTTVIPEASVTDQLYRLRIRFSSNAVLAAARDTIADIGYSLDGGASFTVLLPDLLCTSAAITTGAMTGYFYNFPILVPSGARISCRASVNNATVGTLVCQVRGWGLPEDPSSIKYGRICRAFGINAAGSRGTIFTPGTLSVKGAWTQLGAATVDPIFWWQVGLGVNDSSMQAGAYNVDLGIGAAAGQLIVINDQNFSESANEEISNVLYFESCEHTTPIGAEVFVRASWSQAALDSQISAAAYGVVV